MFLGIGYCYSGMGWAERRFHGPTVGMKAGCITRSCLIPWGLGRSEKSNRSSVTELRMSLVWG